MHFTHKNLKDSITMLYSISVHYTSNKSLSVAIPSNAESPVCPVVFLTHVLIHFRLRMSTRPRERKHFHLCSDTINPKDVKCTI